MLPQNNRLTRMKDFEILFKEGKFCNSDILTLKFWNVEPEKYPKRAYSREDLKIGFVVGLKISKSAVKRNRLKRQMREVVRLLLKEDKLKKGYLAAFIAKPAVLSKEYPEIEKNIVDCLKKVGMLKNI